MGDPTLLLLMALAALTAGWVDAVVGGGGLVQLPALLLGYPSARRRPSYWRRTSSARSSAPPPRPLTYLRRVRPDLRTAVPMAAVAFVGAMVGAFIGLHIPKSAFNPIILVLLVVVGTYTLLKPDLGRETVLRLLGTPAYRVCRARRLRVGVYDGALGPGTGSFLVFALVGLLGYAFLEASAKAKITNLATNLGALAVFIPLGQVMFAVGLVDGTVQPARRVPRRPDRGALWQRFRPGRVRRRRGRLHRPHRGIRARALAIT